MSCCGRNAKYPGVHAMAKDLSMTIVQAMRHAIRQGEILAEEPVVRQRLLICEKCDQKSGVRCLKCGCFLTLKSAIKVATCPINKW